MLAIVSGPRNHLLYAEFGDAIGPPADRKALLRWVLEDYPRRRDEQWRCTPPQGAPLVLELLSEGSGPDLVAAALLALGWYGLPESGPELQRHVGDADPLVRSAALRGLGQIGWMPALAEVKSKLADPDAQVRREALIALAKYGRKETLDLVIAAAPRVPDGAAIAELAARRTRALEAGDIPAFVEAAHKGLDYEDLCVWMPFIWEQLSRIPPDPARPLEERIRAARLLGLGRARKSARSLLATLLRPGNPLPLRVECARALSRLGLPGAVDSLVPLLDVEERELQLAVIAAVGGTGSPRALTPLLDRWEARERTLREPVREAVRALGQAPAAHALLAGWTRPTEAERPLVAAVIEGDRWTTTEAAAWVRPQAASAKAAARCDAVAVLGLIGGPADVAGLAQLAARDPDEQVRWLAALAARSLAGGDVTA